MANNITKRGQVAETMTWITATIVILVVTFIFLAAVTLLAKSKSLGSPLDFSISTESRVVTQQLLFALLAVSNTEGTKIQELIAGEKYGDVMREPVQGVLTRFKEQNFYCSFSVKNIASGGYKVEMGKDAGGTMASLILTGNEVMLRC